MRAINIVGFKNSGKTTLMLALADALEAQGLRVAVVKHSHHELDAPHSDTGRLRKAHSKRTVLALSQGETALFWGEGKELTHMLPLIKADIVLIEGGKKRDFLPRILCLRPEDTAHDLAPELLPHLALATYSYSPEHTHTSVQGKAHFSTLEPKNLEAMAAIITEQAFALPRLNCGSCGQKSCAELARAIVAGEHTLKDCPVLHAQVQLHINGRPIAMNPFVARIMAGAVQGMAQELKGCDLESGQKNTLTFSCTL